MQPAICLAFLKNEPGGPQFKGSHEVFLLKQFQAIPPDRVRSLEFLAAGQAPQTGERDLPGSLQQDFGKLLPYGPGLQAPDINGISWAL